jgi:hypothetical protein
MKHIEDFWVITQCNVLKINRRFWEMRCYILQGRRTREARNWHEEGSNKNKL